MPELPEVHALARYLDQRMAGHAVQRVDIVAVNALRTFAPDPSSLAGRTVTGVGRQGKYLIFDLSGPCLVLHLARGGWVRWREQLPEGRPRPGKGPLAMRLTVDGGAGIDVTEAGTQKRLAVWIVDDLDSVPGLAGLGADPLAEGFSVADLEGLLGSSGSQLKTVLTDQRLLAGIGNAYSDEILHRARMSPFRSASSLGPDDVVRLHRAMVDTLSEAVARSEDLPAGELKDDKRAGMQVHGRTGLPCPVCGDTVRQVAFADKSLQYCPTCQTGGKVLADRRLSRLLK
ncbi:MAG TPA: DNA-formamidopyrimidine glycosylase family protein [Acidimicrobiales bacterium]|nr:DNA-formamidopyrimidine glycosylase family protein [Acidimicrobiales bacterium]